MFYIQHVLCLLSVLSPPKYIINFILRKQRFQSIIGSQHLKESLAHGRFSKSKWKDNWICKPWSKQCPYLSTITFENVVCLWSLAWSSLQSTELEFPFGSICIILELPWGCSYQIWSEFCHSSAVCKPELVSQSSTLETPPTTSWGMWSSRKSSCLLQRPLQWPLPSAAGKVTLGLLSFQ